VTRKPTPAAATTPEELPAAQPLLVTAAVIIESGRVLITRRPQAGRHPGDWEFPGGKVEAGESPPQALVREIREELGVAIAVEDIFEVIYYRYDWGPVLILAYRCRLLERTLRELGVAAYRWVLPAEFGDYAILPADRPILDKLSL
jgi:8-oxo-dGTP diphosphatase